jgi:hypothetical protein
MLEVLQVVFGVVGSLVRTKADGWGQTHSALSPSQLQKAITAEAITVFRRQRERPQPR